MAVLLFSGETSILLILVILILHIVPMGFTSIVLVMTV